MLSPNTLLADKYRIIAEIGEGGFGKVYLGYDVAMERHVAIKELLRNDDDISPEQWREYQARFRKEAQVTSRMAHSNVVSAYALESGADGSLYLVLEYVDGGSLRQLLEAESPLEVGRAIDIAIDLCCAIEAIYKRDIVHRDIKPSNILLTRDGVAKLTDFGVAQVGHETRRTQDAMGHPGTPAYKSPEQATTTGYLDQRSDLYAVGLVLYEMLTGYLYVRNRLPPRRFNPHVPHALNAIVMKALEEDPADRYQLAADMRLDLERVRDEATLGQAQILWNRLLSNRAAAATSALVLLVVAFLGYRLAAPLVGLSAPKNAPAPTVVPTMAPGTGATSPIETAVVILPPTPEPSPLPTATLTPENQFVDVFEPDDQDPAPIEPGEAQQRSFDPATDVDRITWRVRMGLTYMVTTANLTEGVDTTLEVLVNGQQFTSEDVEPGALASQVVFTAMEDGMAIANVYNGGAFGPERRYDLSVILIEPTATPTPPQENTPEVTLAPTETRPTFTPRPTFTAVATHTSTATLTRTRTNTPTQTNTPTRTLTRTSTLTPTRTLTRTPTITRTATPIYTPTPSHTPEPTDTPKPDRSPLPVRTDAPPVE